MAVDGIPGGDAFLLSALGGQSGTPGRPAPLQAGNAGPAPAAQATTPEAEALRQNAQRFNESLRNLILPETTSTENLLFDTRSPLLTALSETRELTPLQQSALLVNETLQNLNFVPLEEDNPLLINELPAALEAAGVLEEPEPVQGNAQLVNETLTALGVTTVGGVTLSPLTTAAQAAAVLETEAEAEAAAALAAAAAPGEGLVGPAAVAATITPTAAPAAATIPVAARFLTPGLTPATLPLSLFPDRTPYTLVVYQINDPAPQPRPPAPIGREVAAIPAVAGIRPTGETRLRQLLLRTREGGRRRGVEYGTPLATVGQAEKSIRSTLVQVNADLAAHGLPLHFVFTKNENGFALDLYDCSYSEACRLTYDVPISFDNLPGVLGNLQHETGIIVDTKL